MKLLHHPGTPCKIERKDISAKIDEKDLEAVRCSNGYGLFGKNNYWVGNEEFQELSIIKIFYPEPFDLSGWGFFSPIQLDLELTKVCNQTCLHCWNDSGNNSSLDFLVLKSILNEFRSNGGQLLKIMGGEPLAHPYFFQLLNFAREKGIRGLEITSNGQVIDREKVIKLSYLASKVNISIHGDSDTHDRITQNKGSYKRAINSVESLIESGVPVSIYFTFMKENSHLIPYMFDLSSKIGAGLRFNLLQNKGRASKMPVISKEQIELARSEIYLQSIERNVNLERSGLFPAGYNRNLAYSKFYGCSALRSYMYISSNGDVYPCSLIETSIGNINNNSMSEIWRGKLAEKIRNSVVCNRSNGHSYCTGKCKAN